MVKLQHVKNKPQLVLSPNRSLSWQQAKWTISIMVLFVMVIALAWSFVGAWLVLPFAGIEVGLFAFLMYKVTKWTYTQQIITFDESEVCVETGVSRRQSRETIDRAGLEIHFTQTELNWYQPEVHLINAHLHIRIGEFLNTEDIKDLKQIFERLGYPVCNNHWWKT